MPIFNNVKVVFEIIKYLFNIFNAVLWDYRADFVEYAKKMVHAA
jgi:hypothetical protein